jgi:hypothetical protein
VREDEEAVTGVRHPKGTFVHRFRSCQFDEFYGACAVDGDEP